VSRTTTRRNSGRQIKHKHAKRSSFAIVGLVVGALLVLSVAGLLLARQRTPSVPGEERIADQGSGLHIPDQTDSHPSYNSNPPTSGYHWGAGLAPWGIQPQPIADEVTTHNLEHGGIVIHYRQDLDRVTVDQLTTLAQQLQQRNPCLILLPRPAGKLDAPIAATAWNYLLKLQAFDAITITKFFQAHVGHGAEPACRPLG